MTPTPAAPRVSVVVATNRGGPFLAEALSSAVGQTYAPVDVLLVDDGSPDPDALRAIADGVGGVEVVRIPPSGVSTARNLGVTRTSGELLAFLDDDDRWHPDRLRRHVEAMTARPAAVLSYCRMRTIDPHGTELVEADQRAARKEHDVVRGQAGVMLPNLVIRREVFEAVGGFDPAYRQGEDLDLVLKAVRRGPFAYVDDVLVDYRYHPGNTTRAHRALAAGLRTILRKHRDAVRAAGRADLVAAYTDRLRANDRFAAWSAARVARADLRQRRPGAAAQEIWWAARFAPTAPLSWLRHRLHR